MVLQGAGSLSNTEPCHFATESLQLYPGLRRETEYTVRAPQLYAPTFPAITSAAEMEQLMKITATPDAEIERLASIISTHGDRTDLNALIRLRPPKTLTTPQPEWMVPFFVSMGTDTILLILYQLLCTLLATIRKARARAQQSDPEIPVTETMTTAPASAHGTQDRDVEALPRTVFYTTYPNQPS
jgi:hypothetical protein